MSSSTVSAIPTQGPKGIIFRSRLEATWAYFFNDVMEWKWDYEPPEIVLRGYIPDFIVTFGDVKLLIEIKGESDFSKLDSYADKILRSGWDGPFMICGASPTEVPNPWIKARDGGGKKDPDFTPCLRLGRLYHPRHDYLINEFHGKMCEETEVFESGKSYIEDRLTEEFKTFCSEKKNLSHWFDAWTVWPEINFYEPMDSRGREPWLCCVGENPENFKKWFGKQYDDFNYSLIPHLMSEWVDCRNKTQWKPKPAVRH